MTDATTLVTIDIDVRAADAVTLATSGTVTVTMPQDTALSAGPVLGKKDPIVATCTAGVWSDLVVPASDNSDETPRNWAYHIAIDTDVCVVEFDAVVPHANTTTDLGTLLATSPPASVVGQAFVPLSSLGVSVATLVAGKVPVGQLPSIATGVTSVTAGDATVTIGGTAVAPTVAVSAIPESKVTGLTTDLAAKALGARSLSAGTGLTGGGDLTADRSFAVAYGTTAGTAAQGNDARLSDSRTPTAHASTHASGGTDAVTPGAIGAVVSSRQVIAGTGLTGGGDLTADRTLVVAYGSAAGTAAQGNDGRLAVRRYAPVTATDQATVLLDLSAGDTHRLTLGGNRTLGRPSAGLVDGVRFVLEVIQPATGGPFTLTPSADYIFGDALPSMVLSTAANAHDLFAMMYNSNLDKILVMSAANGFGV